MMSKNSIEWAGREKGEPGKGAYNGKWICAFLMDGRGGGHFECRKQINRSNKRNFFLVLPPLFSLFVAWVALSSLPTPSPVLNGLGSGNSSDSNGGEQNPCSGAVEGGLFTDSLVSQLLKLCVCDVSIQSDHNFIDAFRLWCWEDSWESLGQQGDQTSQS